MAIYGLRPGSPAGADVKELKILLRMSDIGSDVYDDPTGEALEEFQKKLIKDKPDLSGSILFRTVDRNTEIELKKKWFCTFDNHVNHLRQNGKTCWAYCLAMLIGGTVKTAQTIIDKTKNDQRTKRFLNAVDGLVISPADLQTFCDVHQEFSFYCLGDIGNNWVKNLIYILGISPIKVGMEDPKEGGHALVISSVISDGNRSGYGTYVKIYNSADDPVSGKQGIHWMNYRNLVYKVMFSRFNDRYVFYKKIPGITNPTPPTIFDINNHSALDFLIGTKSFYNPMDIAGPGMDITLQFLSQPFLRRDGSMP